MKPVRTASSNLVYRGPTEDIGDLHCQRLQPGYIRSVWYFTREERARIAEGANLSLTVMGEPIRPMSLHLTSEQGIGEDAPEVQVRLEHLIGQTSGGDGRR